MKGSASRLAEHGAYLGPGHEARSEVALDVTGDTLDDVSRFRAHLRALVVIHDATQLREDLPKNPLVPQTLRLRPRLPKRPLGLGRSVGGGERGPFEEQGLGSERSDAAAAQAVKDGLGDLHGAGVIAPR